MKGGFTIRAPEGNALTKLMHLLVFHELHKMNVNNNLQVEKIVPEQSVLLEKDGNVCEGAFDFLVQTKSKSIGIEILTRPSRGKLKEKLCYAKQVDEFIFVLPLNSLELYKKPKTKIFHKNAKMKFFEKEFNSKHLSVWLFDVKTKKFIEKARFSKVFNVERA